MRYPKRPAMALHLSMVKKYPRLLKARRGEISIESYKADRTSLIEPALKYKKEAGADIVIKNALLFEAEGNPGRLQDIAIANNVITNLGNSGEVNIPTAAHTRMVDAEGHSVLPGFVDSHLHLAVGMQRLQGCDMEAVTTVDEFKQKLMKFSEEKPDEPVLYVFGLHYFETPLIPPENCRHFLDAIIKDKPVLVYAHDLHTAWANTKAITLAGLLHPLPPYPPLIEELGLDDKIILGSDGMPSGEFHEPEVYYFVGGPLQVHFPRSIEKQLADLKTVGDQLASLGITGVHRMALGQPEEDISFLLLILELEQRGRLPVRINTSFSSVADHNMLADVFRAYLVRNALNQARNKELRAADLHDLLVEIIKETGSARHKQIEALAEKDKTAGKDPLIQQLLELSRQIKSTTYKTYVQPHAARTNPHRKNDLPEYISAFPKIRCDTVKIFIDGVIEKNTAYRLDQNPTAGIPEFDQKELDAVVELADKLGLQVAAHSIGNGSVKSMLDAVSKARAKHKAIDQERGHRIPHRIEHIEMCRPEDSRRFGKEHVVASMQPHESPPVTLWHKLVPQKEWSTAFAWKGALASGAILVFGSDWPIVPCDARTGIQHAVTRKPWFKNAREQKISLKEALKAYTSGAGFTEYSTKVKGRIEPGMLADLVILAGDVHDLQKEAVPTPGIRMTICNGKITYDNSTAPGVL